MREIMIDDSDVDIFECIPVRENARWVRSTVCYCGGGCRFTLQDACPRHTQELEDAKAGQQLWVTEYDHKEESIGQEESPG